jgi:hypothetical protein
MIKNSDFLYDVDYFENLRFSRYIDMNGNPVKKDKFKCPYSYDEFVLYDNRTKECSENTQTVYSDRLMQWDYDKFNRCCMNVWENQGQYFDNRQPKDIEKFLSLYLGKDINLTLMLEGCNVSNGYPYWVFFYEIV